MAKGLKASIRQAWLFVTFCMFKGLLQDVQNSFGNLLNSDTRGWMKEEALLAACGFISTGVSYSAGRNVTTWRIEISF